MESSDKYDDYGDIQALPLLVNKAKMDEMSQVDESDVEPMPTNILEDIGDRIHSHPIICRREASYNISDLIKQRW